jgi:hypothetical protein
MGKFFLGITGKVNTLEDNSCPSGIGLGGSPFVGFLQEKENPPDGTMGKDFPPGEILLLVNPL